MEDRKSAYTIYADAVVLCTGYSGIDSESVKLFYPGQEGVIRTGGTGITSAAQKWILELGGTPAMDTAASTMHGYNSTLGIHGDESKIYMRMHMPWVNIHGERFLDESQEPYIWKLDPDSDQPAIRNVPAAGKNVYDVIAQDDHSDYIIFDSVSENAVKHSDVSVFNRCQQENCLLLNSELWHDVHPMLVSRYLDTDKTMPYGIIYQLPVQDNVRRFIDLIMKENTAE
ncbi:MAG: hypothetical protein IJI75_06025 [Solobacterium sp.]|nr:hypothetical protein [Solobacterium sp.]